MKFRYPKIDKIIRSKRKTLALEIACDASLIVRVPERTSLDYIEKIVFKRRFWIKEKQKIAKEKYQRITPKEFVNGEGFLYLGDMYRLSIVARGDVPLSFDKEFQLSRNYLLNARQVFITWYKKEAYQKIKERLDWYSTLFGLKYNKFSITNARKRWGSCSAKGNLHFSWRLIMAPLKIIDYVVIHELVHLTEKNHFKKFWEKVKILLPDSERYKKWLKDNDHLLVIENDFREGSTI